MLSREGGSVSTKPTVPALPRGLQGHCTHPPTPHPTPPRPPSAAEDNPKSPASATDDVAALTGLGFRQRNPLLPFAVKMPQRTLSGFAQCTPPAACGTLSSLSVTRAFCWMPGSSEPQVYTQSSYAMGLDAWVVFDTLVLTLFHFTVLIITL